MDLLSINCVKSDTFIYRMCRVCISSSECDLKKIFLINFNSCVYRVYISINEKRNLRIEILNFPLY